MAYRRVMGLNHFNYIEDVPEFPRTCSKTEHKKYCEEYIKAGAIPKKDLLTGEWYLGNSRSTYVALWNGFRFEFIRIKFSGEYIDRISHFEDDSESDVFVPIKRIIEPKPDD